MQNFPTSRATLPRVRRVTVTLLATIGLLSTMATGASSAPTDPTADMTSPAGYYGGFIDMAVDQPGDTACVIRPDVLDAPECFDTEAEADEFGAELLATYGPVGSRWYRASLFSNCASPVKLYEGAWGTGSQAHIWGQRFSWTNLSGHPHYFNQKTSSYRIGACDAIFADYANGGGAHYPTQWTEANDVFLGMASGWDNDVSSVYIN